MAPRMRGPTGTTTHRDVLQRLCLCGVPLKELEKVAGSGRPERLCMTPTREATENRWMECK